MISTPCRSHEALVELARLELERPGREPPRLLATRSDAG